MAEEKQLVVNLAFKSSNSQQQIKNLQNSTKEMASEFKNAGAGIKDFENTTDGAKAKLKLLEGSVENTKKKLDIYNKKLVENKETLDKANKAYSDSDKKVKDLSSQLEKAETVFGKNSKEVKDLSKQLKEAEKDFQNKGKAVMSADNQLKNIQSTINNTEAELKNLQAEVQDTTNKFKGMNLQQIGQNFQNTGNNIKAVGDKVSGLGGKLMLGVTAPIAAIAGASINASVALTEMQRKSEVVFGDMVTDVANWSLENERAFGLGSGTIQGMTTDLADLVQGLGMTKEASFDMSKGATELAVKLANWGNTAPTNAMDDLKSALAGSHKAMEKYGVKLNESVLNQYTMNMGLGESFNKLDEATKAQVRYEAILGSSANAVQFFDDGNRNMSFYLTEAKEQIGNVSENIGMVLLPSVLEITKKIADLTAKIAEWSAKNPELVETIVKIAGSIAMIAPVLLILGKFIGLIGTVVTGIGGLMTAISTAGGVMAFFTATILPVVVAIGTVIAIVFTLYQSIKSNFDGIKKAVENLIKQCQPQFETFKAAFMLLWETCKSIYETVIQPIFDLIGQVISRCIRLATPILQTLMTVFSIVFETISIVWEGVGKPVFTFIMEIVQLLWEKFNPVFVRIQDLFSSVCKTIQTVWNGVLKPVLEILMSVIQKIGENVSPIFEGFKEAIVGAMDAVTAPIQWVIDKLQSLSEWLGGLGEKASSFFEKLNPFKKSVQVGVEYQEDEPFMMRSLDNIALSGSYYNSRTVDSNNLRPHIQSVSGRIAGLNNLEKIANSIENKMGKGSKGVMIDKVIINNQQDTERALNMVNFFAKV